MSRGRILCLVKIRWVISDLHVLFVHYRVYSVHAMTFLSTQSFQGSNFRERSVTFTSVPWFDSIYVFDYCIAMQDVCDNHLCGDVYPSSLKCDDFR